MRKISFVYHRPKPGFWWSVFIRQENGPDRFIRRTKAVSSEQAVNNVWYTDIRNPYAMEGAMEDAKLLRSRMFAKPTSPPPQLPSQYRPRPKGQLLLFRRK